MIHRVEPDGQRNLEKLLRVWLCLNLIYFSGSAQEERLNGRCGAEGAAFCTSCSPDKLVMSFRQKEN